MNKISNDTMPEPIGYSALIKQYALKTMPHYRLSYLISHGRAYTLQKGYLEVHFYPKSYALKDAKNPLHQLEFAIKYDGIHLAIISQVFRQIATQDVLKFITEKPSSKYRRKLWFLYEYLTDNALPLADIKNTAYVDLLDSEHYYTGSIKKSKRHAVNNNLLGNAMMCPFVRKTKKLMAFEEKQLQQIAKHALENVDPLVLVRATHYLYTKETRSSFGIEHVKPDQQRTAKFVRLLEGASTIPAISKPLLIKLQNSIVDEPYQDKDYRQTQNYVGELTLFYQHRLHYISPKPDDIASLMAAYLALEAELMASGISPVIIAAILGFAFVFLHPFEDGNGRIHRFLVHYVLSKLNFTPDNIIFPISAVILKNRKDYDAILETFSKPLLAIIENYDLQDDGQLTVHQDTRCHYQYVDFTHFAEYLFHCVDVTIQEDFKEEIAFITRYDKTKIAIQHIIDMPDIKIDRIIRCISQNDGKLGQKMRRTYFSELDDVTIKAIEKVIQQSMLKN